MKAPARPERTGGGPSAGVRMDIGMSGGAGNGGGTWDYDSSVVALHEPGLADDCFRLAPHYAPPALCAEMARLVYCSDLDRVTTALRRVGFDSPAWFRAAGTDAFLTRSRDVAVLAFRGTEGPKLQRLIDPARVQRLFQQSGLDWQETMRRLFAGSMPDLQEGMDRIARECQDLFTDLDALPQAWPAGGRVHRGCVGALARVWPQIEAQLAALDVPVLYTGHSPGAALATLAAGRRPPDTLYTFGAPRVGDGAFVATLAGTVVYRYVNCCDVVAHLPPTYQPAGILRYIDSNGRLADREEDEATRLTARTAHFRKTFGQWDKIWIRDLVDHAPVNYVKALLRN